MGPEKLVRKYRDRGAELVVLARYMQVLSGEVSPVGSRVAVAWASRP